MHPFIYSSKLTGTPKDLGRFRLRPGDHLEASLSEEHVALLARPKGWTSRLMGRGPRPVGLIDPTDSARLRPLVEEGRHMRIRVVNIEGLTDNPKGLSISVWVDS